LNGCGGGDTVSDAGPDRTNNGGGLAAICEVSMNQRLFVSLVTVGVLLLARGTTAYAQGPSLVFGSEFAAGPLADQGWKAEAGWEVAEFPKEVKNQPGPVARFQANTKAGGALSRTFAELKDPRTLALTLRYGWGWGDAGQGADSVAWMLLDGSGNGYAFKVHRTKANWAVQWGRAAGGQPAGDMTWAGAEIDASQKSVMDGGGLARIEIQREAGGAWTIHGPDWNAGAGASVAFSDDSTRTFSRLVLLGSPNFDEQIFGSIRLTAEAAGPTVAIPAQTFLDSLGIVTTFPDRGQPLAKTVEMVDYCGFRWVRAGVEGLKDDGPMTIQTLLDLHRQAGVKLSCGLGSGGADVAKWVATGRALHKAGALLAFEGNNEPNNWGVKYLGVEGGGRNTTTWVPVAMLQRDAYAAVKADPELKTYPVWGPSEVGGQSENVGLQFLTIPPNAGTLLPAGTAYADFVNVHNYTYHPNAPGLEDNKTWNAADPGPACKIDGLYGNHGQTWYKKFPGYSEAELRTLPRVTTETGTTIGGPVTEAIQGINILTTYLDQFRRGWAYTSVYLLRDRTDEAGNQSFGLFDREYKPRKAAVYLHNLTTILADQGTVSKPTTLDYAIANQPPTMHDLLLQKADGSLWLVVWNERVEGSDTVKVALGGTFEGVRLYDPTVGSTAVKTVPGKVDAVELTLSDHPVVVGIPRQSGVPSPSPSGRR
jgi:hypothetical protein